MIRRKQRLVLGKRINLNCNYKTDYSYEEKEGNEYVAVAYHRVVKRPAHTSGDAILIVIATLIACDFSILALRREGIRLMFLLWRFLDSCSF